MDNTSDNDIMNLIITNYLLKSFYELVENETFIVKNRIVLIQEEFVSSLKDIFSITNVRCYNILIKTMIKLKFKPFIISNTNINCDAINNEEDETILDELCELLKITKMSFVKFQSYEKAMKYRDLEKYVKSVVNKKKGLTEPFDESIPYIIGYELYDDKVWDDVLNKLI